jgi:hypothetical protein
MIEFEPQHVLINRIIVHKILEQKATETHSEVQLENTLIQIDERGKAILLTRIVDALGKQSKSFDYQTLYRY